MAISLNYRFLFRTASSMAVATALLGMLLLQVLDHHEKLVPLWGQQSMATDLLSFSFILGFILSWVTTKLTRKALQKKKVLPLHWHLKSQTLIDRLPANMLSRAFMLGLAGVVLAGIVLFLLKLRHLSQLPYHQYLVLFVLHAVSLTAAITVMAVYRALGDRVEKQVVVKQKSTPSLQE